MNIKHLTLEQVLLIHEMQIEEFGGSAGIREIGLLESAVFRPQTSFGGQDLYKSVFDKAAVLIHLLILNNPFVDGNKRMGLVACIVFLGLNGYALEVEQDELVEFAKQIAQNELELKEITEWLRDNSVNTS